MMLQLQIVKRNCFSDTGGSTITATQNRLFDVSMLNIQTMTVPDTQSHMH